MSIATKLTRLVAVAACAATTHLGAACLLNDYSVEAEYARSTAVVLAKVSSERLVPSADEAGFDDGVIYTVKVQESLRGSTSPTVEVFSENSSGRYPMSKNRSYVLFLYEAGGRLSADYCGNSGLASQRQGVLVKLRALKQSGDRDQKPNQAVHPTACTIGYKPIATGALGARRG
jgi:hypothetical protein